MRPALVTALGAALLLSLSCLPSAAQGRKLLVAVMDQVAWRDLLAPEVKAPTVRRLAKEGGVGLMSVRTARPSGGGGGYLTIGAGSRAGSPPVEGAEGSLEGRAFQATEMVAGEPARRSYTAYTGWSAGDNAIVHLGIGELTRQNMPTTYPVSLGLLGTSLRRAGLRVACLGNADTADSPHREAVAIGMDEQGLVELGNVGAGLLRPQPSRPYRLTTDGERLLAAFQQVAAAADLVAVDLGETSRVGWSADSMLPAAARRARYRAIEQSDNLLAHLLRSLPEGDWAVMVLTPTARPPEPEEQLASLTPVIFRTPGGKPGLLTSPSTRRAGLVVNTDVAATILGYFGLETPTEVVGRPIRIEPSGEDSLARMVSDEARQSELEAARRLAFRWLAVLTAIALWGTAGFFALNARAPAWPRPLLRALLLLVLAAPPALLMVGFGRLSLPQMLGGAAAIAAAIALLGSAVTGWRSGHSLPAVLLAGLLVYDLGRGGTLIAWSPLGYSAAAGARFYGIGNEFGGALLGAALVAAASLLASREQAAMGQRALAVAGLLVITGMVGYPRFGANLGMSLACAVGFAYFAPHLWEDRPTWADGVAMLLVAGVVAGGAIAVDVLRRGTEASHIGMFVSTMKAQGWGALGQVVIRKWAMNWALVRSSLWADAALAGVGLLSVFLLVQPRRAVEALSAQPWMGPAVRACVVGAVAAWAFNDSGIVAAALVLLYGAGTLAYLGLAEA